MEKRELGKIDFELIDEAFKALLKSQLNPMTADKVTDLRDPAGWRSTRPRSTDARPPLPAAVGLSKK